MSNPACMTPDGAEPCAAFKEEVRRGDCYKSDVETFTRFAEKFGDLSNCYDVQDVCAVIQRKFDQVQTRPEETTK